MATTDTVCFGDADGVTHDPYIDGLTDYDFLPFNEPAEVGYTMGSRLTYEGGALPRVVFQGVRSVTDNHLVLGFMCRFDTSFDPADTIVLLVRSNATPASPRRMIVITPNTDGIGADEPFDPKPALQSFQIRRAHALSGAQLKFYRQPSMPTPGIFWDEFSPTIGTPGSHDAMGHPVPGSGTPGIVVRARSWLPGRMVGMDPECCWSVEVSMPRDGSGGWITLDDDFGLFFSVVRIINPGGGMVQSVFPTTAPILDGTPGVDFPNPAADIQWGHALIPAAQIPPNTNNTGVGVHFVNGAQGVGRRPVGSPMAPLTGTIEMMPGGAADNEMVAQIANTGAVPANGVSAEFRFANWGLPNAWDTPLGLNPNPTAAINLAPGGSGEVSSPWPRSQVPASYVGHEHQCMMVQLSSPHDVNFNQAAVRRNMDFAHLSQITRTAEVSGENYPDPASGAQEFLLETFCRRINVAAYIHEDKFPDPDKHALVKSALQFAMSTKGPKLMAKQAMVQQDKWTNSVIYVWITVGYRRTGTFTKFYGKTYENLDDAPGAFGVVAYHEGLQDELAFSFDGPGIVQYAPGSYGLKVPHKGRTGIDVMLSAGDEHRGGDVSTKVPKAPWPEPGTLATDGPGTPGTLPDLPKGCLAALFGLFGKKT